ncbi:hypothetical protein Acr_13g0004200 [Actinidia rufa]|uniref:O-methyltransferase dimerisation domain-containing protein n=1 Tax=Actinidia rufa TaxID=165716 RepID=A0A7J0FLF4_9ERIC|nr:hypothetical protein Acr_13g0004200 [Actinidia rufa]
MEKCSSDEQGKELPLQSQAHIWNHLFNFINSMSLKCAIELDIPDIVNNHGRPMTLSELVAALPINPQNPTVSTASCAFWFTLASSPRRRFPKMVRMRKKNKVVICSHRLLGSF